MKWSSLDILTEDDAECTPLSSFSDKGTIINYIIFQTFVFGFVLLLLIIDPCSMGLGRWLERIIDKTEFLFLSK